MFFWLFQSWWISLAYHPHFHGFIMLPINGFLDDCHECHESSTFMYYIMKCISLSYVLWLRKWQRNYRTAGLCARSLTTFIVGGQQIIHYICSCPIDYTSFFYMYRYCKLKLLQFLNGELDILAFLWSNSGIVMLFSPETEFLLSSFPFLGRQS